LKRQEGPRVLGLLTRRDFQQESVRSGPGQPLHERAPVQPGDRRIGDNEDPAASGKLREYAGQLDEESGADINGI
jgi:hypothetical protein